MEYDEGFEVSYYNLLIACRSFNVVVAAAAVENNLEIAFLYFGPRVVL